MLWSGKNGRLGATPDSTTGGVRFTLRSIFEVDLWGRSGSKAGVYTPKKRGGSALNHTSRASRPTEGGRNQAADPLFKCKLPHWNKPRLKDSTSRSLQNPPAVGAARHQPPRKILG
jgi:hypothetical protein